MWFEVEFVFPKEGLIFARVLEEGPFTVTATSTLAGCPLLESLSSPRSLTSYGQPRYDLFAFRLRNRKETLKFKVRAEVFLENT